MQSLFESKQAVVAPTKKDAEVAIHHVPAS